MEYVWEENLKVFVSRQEVESLDLNINTEQEILPRTNADMFEVRSDIPRLTLWEYIGTNLKAFDRITI